MNESIISSTGVRILLIISDIIEMLFGFVEFADVQGAKLSYTLSGLNIGGYPLRIDHSNSPVVQPTAYGPGMADKKKESMKMYQRSQEHKLDSVLSKINEEIFSESTSDKHSKHRVYNIYPLLFYIIFLYIESF